MALRLQSLHGMRNLALPLLCTARCWSIISLAQDTVYTYQSEFLKVAHLNKED